MVTDTKDPPPREIVGQAEFLSRFNYVIESLGFASEAAFARHLGVSRQTIYNWQVVRCAIGQDTREVFEQKTGFDFDWVNRGVGQEKARHVLDAEIDIQAALKSVALQNWLSAKLFQAPISPLNHESEPKGRAARKLHDQALALLATVDIPDSPDPAQAPKIHAARLLQQRALDLLKEAQGLLRNSASWAQCPTCSSVPSPIGRGHTA